MWLDKIVEFCEVGKVDCYAEKALNEIGTQLNIQPLDVKDMLCSEIDNPEDLAVAASKLKEVEKRTVYDVVGVPKPKYNSLKEWLDKDGMEYIASFSSFFSEKVLMGAFAAKKEQMLEFAYPRLDVLGLCENDNLKFCNKYSRDLLKYIEKAKGFQKVFLYMPTWRDDDPDYIEKAGIDYDL